jgi:hypothetical protein
MSSQKKHINIFDELVRVLNLKNNTHKQQLDDVVPTFDTTYTPSHEKYQKAINELISHQIKINRRKTKHKIYYTLLATLVILLSSLLYIQNHKNYQKQNQEVIITKKENICLSKDSVLSESNTLTDQNIQSKNINPNSIIHVNQPDRDTVKIVITDTSYKKIYQTDTLVKIVEITDTIKINYYKSVINPRDYCQLPKVYRILFDEKSVYIDEKYYNDISELANNILECQNLHKVEIIGYYTQRFLIFNNKKLVHHRIENIKKKIKNHNVSSRILIKSQETLIKTIKSNNQESAQLVEIILKD